MKIWRLKTENGPNSGWRRFKRGLVLSMDTEGSGVKREAEQSLCKI